MLRATSYTVLICGISAGAAFGLAVAHDAANLQLPSTPVLAAPEHSFDLAPEPSAPVIAAPAQPSQPVVAEPHSETVTASLDPVVTPAPVRMMPVPSVEALDFGTPIVPAPTQSIPKALHKTPSKTKTAPPAHTRKPTPAPRAVFSSQNADVVGQDRVAPTPTRSEPVAEGSGYEYVPRPARAATLSRSTPRSVGETWTTGVYR